MKKNSLFIYHNIRCSKSRAVIKYLESKEIKFKTINYLNEPIDEKFLKKTLLVLEDDIQKVVRINEKTYKTKFKNKTPALSIDEINSLLKEYPILIQRPIAVIINNNNFVKSTICRPPEKIQDFLI